MRVLSVVFIFATVAIIGSNGSDLSDIINVSLDNCYKSLKCNAYTALTNATLYEPTCVKAFVTDRSGNRVSEFSFDTTACVAEIMKNCLKLVEEKQLEVTKGRCDANRACEAYCASEPDNGKVCGVIQGKTNTYRSLCDFYNLVNCRKYPTSDYFVQKYTKGGC